MSDQHRSVTGRLRGKQTTTDRPAHSAFDVHKMAYWQSGYSPLRIEPGTKACRDKNWQSGFRPVSLDSANPGYGIGLLMGTEFEDGSRLGAIDVDRDDLMRPVRALLKSPCERFGSKGGAIVVRTAEGIDKNYQLKMHDGTSAGECLFHKANCVIPPTIHKDTGKPYRWLGKSLLEVRWDELPLINAGKLRFLKTLIKSQHLPVLLDGDETHEAVLRLVAQLAVICEDDGLIEEVVAACFPEGYRGDSLKELPRMVRDARRKIESGRWHHAANDPFPEDGLPVIKIRQGTLREQVDLAEEALVNCADTPVYLQAGRPVQPVVEEADAARGRKTTVIRVSPLTVASMRYQLSKAAKWGRYNARTRSLSPADPPKEVAETLLTHGNWRLFKELAGIIETPTLRPDFSVLSGPGYDSVTGLLLVNPPPMPDIPEVPSCADAEAALRLLNALLDEFPFVDGASRSVALSALMTPVVRGAMKRAPLHVFCGPVAGTGKSYLADLVAAIITGRECPTLSAADRQEEFEKRLAGSVLSGEPVISLDNMNGEIGGSFLCQLLTQERLEIRPLGQTGNLNVESRATVLANGNNITVAGDLVRRSIQCSLDPQMERPELREFGGNPFNTIVAERGNYVAAVLVLVRAYLVAGEPFKVKPLASFEGWSRLVRAALMWLGCDDPVGTMDQLRVEDPHATQLSNFLTAWQDAIHGGSDGRIDYSVSDIPMTAKELCASPIHDFSQALIEATGGRESDISASPMKLGKFLRKHKDRICNGLKICGEMDKHEKVMTWWLAHADGSRVAKDSSEPRAVKARKVDRRPSY